MFGRLRRSRRGADREIAILIPTRHSREGGNPEGGGRTALGGFPIYAMGLGARVLSESGFAGLEDSQDSPIARVFGGQALVRARIGGTLGCGENRKTGETKS